MKKLILLMFLIATESVFCQEMDFNYHRDFTNILEKTKITNDPLNYDILLQRFSSIDTTISNFEIIALLIGFTESPHYKPYNYFKQEREISRLNEKGLYKEALIKADSLLAFVPVSQAAIIEKGFSHYYLNEEELALKEFWKFSKIMTAMVESGPGDSIENAMFSLGPGDGQNLITVFLGGNIGTMGSGFDSNNYFIDILQLIKENEETGEIEKRTLFFQIEHAKRKMFSEEDMKTMFEKIENTDKKNGKKAKKSK